jgi:hypothetical protein
MRGRRFPRPWRVEPIPGGYRVVDANGLALAHVYGEPPKAIATSPNRLTNDEARRISSLIARLPELVELEQDSNKARSRRRQQPLRLKPVTIGDLIQGREVAGGSLRQLPARAAPLPQSRDTTPVQAYAGARGGKASRLLEVRCQEQRDQ